MELFDQGRALLIGVADYKHIDPLPDVVTQDVQGIYQLLIDPARCGYPFTNVQTLLDGQATKNAILEAFGALAARCDTDSTAFIYFSGHGASVDDGDEAGQYLLPVDVRSGSQGIVPSTGISHEEFTACLDAIPARRIAVFFDCCHAGGIGTLKSGANPTFKNLPDDYYQILGKGEGRAIFASSRATETSLILPGAANSLFTEVLLQGLRGEAANRTKGVVRVVDLYTYISDKIGEFNVEQHPVFRCSTENFPIALHRGETAPAPVALHPAREADAALRIQTPTGLGDGITLDAARIVGRPSVESRIESERPKNNLPLGASFMASMGALGQDNDSYYNDQLPKFLKKYNTYLDDKNRLAKVVLVLTNGGNLPATDVQVVVNFEGIGRCVRRADLPSRPKRPRKPDPYGAGILSRMADLQIPLSPSFDRPAAFKRETEPFSMSKTVVEWRVPHLQHGRNIVLEPLFLLLDLSGEGSTTIQVPFEIHATQLVEAKTGALSFDVAISSIHWTQAEQNDVEEERLSDKRDEE